MIHFASSNMARHMPKDRPKLPTEKEHPQVPTFPNKYIGHSFKSVPNERNHSFMSVPNEWGQKKARVPWGIRAFASNLMLRAA